MIPLPKLPTGHADEWVEIDHAELQRIQREAMRVALNYVMRELDGTPAADDINNMRIEGEQHE